MRIDIKDSRGMVRGWADDSPNETKYFGFTKGYIGRFDKKANRYFYMIPGKLGVLGPMADIGTSEVLQAEGSK
jgi:hypothetical protein